MIQAVPPTDIFKTHPCPDYGWGWGGVPYGDAWAAGAWVGDIKKGTEAEAAVPSFSLSMSALLAGQALVVVCGGGGEEVRLVRIDLGLGLVFGPGEGGALHRLGT